MKTKQEIITFLQNEPLIEWRLSSASIDWNSLRNAECKSLFFGVGLCTAKEPAFAVPFDILQFFLVAEKLRRFLLLGKIIVLVADRHALTNSFMSEELVDKLTKKTTNLFEKIIQNFQLSSFEIRKASEMFSENQVNKLFPQVIGMPNQYLAQELADVLWMQKHDGLIVKLGWTIDGSPISSGHDERFFDWEIRKLSLSPISFFFTHAGRTFDRHRQKTSPYISVRREHRLFLDAHENVTHKLKNAQEVWGDESLGGATKHLANIARCFESLFGNFQGMTLSEKIQFIMDKATKGATV